MQYPIGSDMPMGMPGTERWGKLANFETLRTLADLYSVARRSIELRKNELRGIGWDVAPTAQAAKAMRGDHKAARDFQERRAKVVRFFRKPDPNYADFTSWFTVMLEEFFVTDATALYLQPSRVPGKGLMGTNLAALDAIDGSLVKPLVDIRGGSPPPPNPSFQQFEYGVPRVDLMSLITDDSDLGETHCRVPWRPVALPAVLAARMDRLRPIFPGDRTGPNHGGPEQAAVPAELLRRKGRSRACSCRLGDTAMTPSQLRELQDALNAIAGDQAWKHKIIVLPGWEQDRPAEADDARGRVRHAGADPDGMGFDMQPFELGILPQLSAAASASSGAARQSVTAHVELRQRKSTIPILLFLKMAIFDRIIQDVCGQRTWSGSGKASRKRALRTRSRRSSRRSAPACCPLMRAARCWAWSRGACRSRRTRAGPRSGAGFVPLTGVSQATATPLGGAPGPAWRRRTVQDGRPVRPRRPRPGPAAPQVPATTPRNRMSRSQRQGQAQQVSAAQNRTGSVGTPAHSGARATQGPVAPLRAAAERTGRPTAASQSRARATKVIQGMVLAPATRTR